MTLFIHTGPRASDQHQVPDVSTSTLLGDLMTGWRKDYGLREQDEHGKLMLANHHSSEFDAFYTPVALPRVGGYSFFAFNGIH